MKIKRWVGRLVDRLEIMWLFDKDYKRKILECISNHQFELIFNPSKIKWILWFPLYQTLLHFLSLGYITFLLSYLLSLYQTQALKKTLSCKQERERERWGENWTYMWSITKLNLKKTSRCTHKHKHKHIYTN